MLNIITVYHNDISDLLTVDHVDFIGHKIGKVVKTDEGYITGEAAVAKVGILSYVLTDGSIRRELVTNAVLSNQDSINTLKMKPITNQHPSEILLDSRTVKKRKVGFTGENIRMVGDHLVSSLTITDNDAVTSIEHGSNELSPGYQVKLLLKPGRLDSGEEYDAVQQFRKYNHLATCDLARGGRDLRLNFDSAVHCDGFEIHEDAKLTTEKRNALPDSDFCFVRGTGANKVRKFPAHDAAHVRNGLSRLSQSNLSSSDKSSVLSCLKNRAKKFNVEVSKDSFNEDDYSLNSHELILIKRKGKNMPNIRINGIDYATDSQEIVNHVSSLEGKVDTLTVDLKNVNIEVDKGNAAKDSLQEKYDSVSKDIPAKVSEAVKQRLAIERVAVKVLKEDDLKKIDSFSDIELQKKVILAKCKDAKLDDKNEVYIAARFDQVVEDLPSGNNNDGNNNNNNNSMSQQRQHVYNTDNNNNTDEVDGDKARLDMVKSISEGWKQPINTKAAA